MTIYFRVFEVSVIPNPQISICAGWYRNRIELDRHVSLARRVSRGASVSVLSPIRASVVFRTASLVEFKFMPFIALATTDTSNYLNRRQGQWTT